MCGASFTASEYNVPLHVVAETALRFAVSLGSARAFFGLWTPAPRSPREVERRRTATICEVSGAIGVVPSSLACA
jgi:hypothetical protein